MATIHKFTASLAKEQANASWPVWERTYRAAFPTFASMYYVRQDGLAQRRGIDRVINLQSGKRITVDEKLRDEDYGDIALEYYSDTEHKTPGWIAKDLMCDYIAYGVKPANKVYLIPFQPLRLAWLRHKEEWIRDYKKVTGYNEGYYSTSVGIPPHVLFNAINEAMLFQFK